MSRKFGDWQKALRATDSKRMSNVIDKVFKANLGKNALIVQRTMKTGIVDQKWKWPPLSKVTIALKGSSKALIDRGDLLNSITIQPITGTVAFVGVLRTAKKGTKEIYNIGMMMENGADIAVTPRMRRFLAIKFQKKTGEKLDSSKAKRKGFIHIPARPFIAPAYEAARPAVIANMAKDGRRIWDEMVGK